MTEFHVEVVQIGDVQPLENSDSLDITMVHGGYPVIFRRGQFKSGDLAVYVPVDAVVAPNDPRFAFLGDHRRIRAKRLRGTFSMGLLTEAQPGWEVGQDVSSELHITQYDPPEPGVQGDPKVRVAHESDAPDPGLMPYYDIEGLRRWKSVIESGTEVVITEKVHGESSKFVHDGERLHIGSRNRWKKPDYDTKWSRVAKKYDLEAKLKSVPMMGLYGECHGYTGGFPYGVPVGDVGFRVFDIMDCKTRKFLDYDDMLAMCKSLDLPTVPELYRGPWSDDLKSLADGKSTLDNHIREGFVVKPVRETYHMRLGRVILKMHGEQFLLKSK